MPSTEVREQPEEASADSESRIQREAADLRNRLEAQTRAIDLFDIVAETDRRGLITHVNDKFVEISKYSREELLGKDHRILNSGLHPKTFFREMWASISQGQVWTGEIRNRAKDGTFYWVSTVITPLYDSQGKFTRFLSLRRDITRQKQAEEALRESEKNRREMMEKHREEIMAFVCHELRSPLMSIRAAADFLRCKEDGKALPAHLTSTQLFERIDQGLRQIDRVSRDLMEEALYHTKDLSFVLKPVALIKLVREIVERFRTEPLMKAHPHVSLEFLPDASSEIVGAWDADRLTQIISNLLTNAVKYSKPEGGKIEVFVDLEGEKAHLRISDQGVGIPPENLESIFEIFTRAPNAERSGVEGIGVGLRICRDIAERLGGRIWAESNLHEGSEFHVLLPLKPRESAH